MIVYDKHDITMINMAMHRKYSINMINMILL